MSAFQDLLDLLLPTKCVLCSALGSPICSNCRPKIITKSRVVTRGHLQGVAVSEYGAVEHDLLKSFKEKGQTGVLSVLAAALATPLSQAAENVGDALLVPMPSSRANYLKRGYEPAKLMARKANALAGYPCRVVSALSFQRVVEDQAGLNARARHSNLAGSMSANRAVNGRHVILFDDIVTTGATILEGARAVSKSGGEVLGFLTFSETILKTQTKT